MTKTRSCQTAGGVDGGGAKEGKKGLEKKKKEYVQMLDRCHEFWAVKMASSSSPSR
jgi:hypothetical protein